MMDSEWILFGELLFLRKAGSLYHIAQRSFDASLPDWKKMPLCNNGGLHLRDWEFHRWIKSDEDIYETQVCATCRRVAETKVHVLWAESIGI